jgi:hypothetical protein
MRRKPAKRIILKTAVEMPEIPFALMYRRVNGISDISTNG